VNKRGRGAVPLPKSPLTPSLVPPAARLLKLRSLS
jgi:hypothetical protein